MDHFEKASRLKLRFETGKGELTTEDLWELPLETLDSIAKKVNTQLRNEGEESFIPNKTSRKSATHNDLRLDLLKHVIEVRVKEQDDRRARADRVAQISKLKELAERKADEQLASKSLEDIQKEIAALEAAVV